MSGEGTIYYPQDEMNTMLLPVTSGCTYNQCAFCSMYKDTKYKEMPFHFMEVELMNAPLYTEKVFLTGGDPLAIGFVKMEKLLTMITKYLPYCACVASYASIRSISKYSLQELSLLHERGLRLLYIGFETGRDDILQLMKKSHRLDEALKEARRLNEANLPFNSIIMYGIAGKGEGVKNALATAKMINCFKTQKIITMNLMVFFRTKLKTMVDNGEFQLALNEERILEIKTLLENLQVIQPTIFDTTHPTNIVKIKGTLPFDKELLIDNLNSW